jgi:hypothetical protein
MKNNKYLYTKITCCFGLIFITIIGCERNLSEEAVFASLANTAEIFTDAPVGMGSNFYFPYGPDDTNPVGSKLTAWSVDNNESYEGSASMRFDVPNSNDPEGNFAGAIFLIDGTGRDLTGYNALTFWAKASQGATIAEMGFGETKFATKLINFNLSTQWTKYIIPIPDASKLTEERGMLFYSAGSINDMGYTFWLDEVKFEKLGTIAQPQPAILNGVDETEQAFVGSEITLTGTQTFNLGSGVNQTTSIAPSYFTFSSTDVDVARVSELGVVSVVGEGTVTITAILAGVKAKGSLTLEVLEEFNGADTPPERNSEDVISIFSEAYTNVNELNFAVFNDAGVQVELENFAGNQVVYYNDLDFVGLGWNGTVDVSTMTHLHLDVQVNDSSSPVLTVELIDFGVNNSEDGGDDTGGGLTITGSTLIEGEWLGIDIPINNFTQATGGGFLGSPNLNNIARVVLVSNGSSFIVDNIYFYK